MEISAHFEDRQDLWSTVTCFLFNFSKEPKVQEIVLHYNKAAHFAIHCQSMQ